MSEDDRREVYAALMCLGSALIDHNHRWADGEREMFERACEIIDPEEKLANEVQS